MRHSRLDAISNVRDVCGGDVQEALVCIRRVGVDGPDILKDDVDVGGNAQLRTQTPPSVHNGEPLLQSVTVYTRRGKRGSLRFRTACMQVRRTGPVQTETVTKKC